MSSLNPEDEKIAPKESLIEDEKKPRLVVGDDPAAKSELAKADHEVVHKIRSLACSNGWNSSKLDKNIGKCKQCKQEVFKLDDPSAEDIANLIARQNKLFPRGENKPFRRSDGTYVFYDCLSVRKKANSIFLFLGILPIIGALLLVPLGITLHYPKAVSCIAIGLAWLIGGCFAFARAPNTFVRILICVIVLWQVGYVLLAISFSYWHTLGH